MSQQESQRRKLPQWLLVRKDPSLDHKRLNLMLDLRKLNLLQVHKRLSLLLALKKGLRNHNLLLDHKKLNLLMGPRSLSQLLENRFQALRKIVPPLGKVLIEGVKLNKVQPLEMEASMMRLLLWLDLSNNKKIHGHKSNHR